MIKCEVIEQFDLKDFHKLQNIERKGADMKGRLFVGDLFECDEKMADYLMGDNKLKKQVVKTIEVIPEVVEEPKTVEEPTPAPKKKKTSKK